MDAVFTTSCCCKHAAGSASMNPVSCEAVVPETRATPFGVTVESQSAKVR